MFHLYTSLSDVLKQNIGQNWTKKNLLSIRACVSLIEDNTRYINFWQLVMLAATLCTTLFSYPQF